MNNTKTRKPPVEINDYNFYKFIIVVIIMQQVLILIWYRTLKWLRPNLFENKSIIEFEI